MTPPVWPVVCVCVLLVLAVLAVFGQTAHFEFVNYDDPAYVYENARVASPLSCQGLAWAFSHLACSLYHPLTMISLMFDYQVHGLDAGGYHLTNVLLHAASAVLLFLIILQMTGALWRAAFVAAVFAIHPLRVESVAWVSERKDVLAAFFFILAIGSYLRYVRKPHSLGRYLTVAGFFLLALLSKPTAVTLPFVLLLLDYWPLGRFAPRNSTRASDRPMDGPRYFGIPRRLFLEKIPLLALAAAVCVVTFVAAGKAVASLGDVSMPVRIANAAVSCCIYLRQMVWPAWLAAFYPYPEQGRALWITVLAFLLLTLVSAGAFSLWRRRPWFFVGWFWYLGMLVPVIGLVQDGAFAHADRNTYLPQIGLYLLLTWAVADLAAAWRCRRVILGGLSAGILGALTYCAHAQTSWWRNSESLWNHTLSCTSANSFAHYSLGIALGQKGRGDAAIAQYRQALEINPDFVLARSNLGAAFDQQGDTDQAVAQYRMALAIQPDNAQIRVNLGNVLSEKGQFVQAMEQYHKALAINPSYEDAHFNQGIALFRKGDWEGAIAQYRAALDIRPEDAAAHNYLGMALAKAGRIDQAISSYREAMRINPRSADACDNLAAALAQHGKTKEAIEFWHKTLAIKPDQISALNNLAWPLATTLDASLRNGVEALALAEKASQLSGGRNPIVLHTLAAAYAETGRYGDASATARRALELAAVQKNGDLISTLRKEIKLYDADTPVRDTPQ